MWVKLCIPNLRVPTVLGNFAWVSKAKDLVTAARSRRAVAGPSVPCLLLDMPEVSKESQRGVK